MSDSFDIEVVGGLEQIDPEDANADVFVTLSDGRQFVGTFFTLRNIETLMSRHATTGESLSGRYFWASDMVIVKELTRVAIRDVIQDLLRTGEFENALSRVEPHLSNT